MVQIEGKEKLSHLLRESLKRTSVKNECGFEIIQILTNELYNCLKKGMLR